MQNSFQTPQAKYAYRLLVFSTMSPQSVTCQIHFMVLTHLVEFFYQVVLTMSEVSLRVSSLQPTCFRLWLHQDDEDSMLYVIYSAATLSKLASSYAPCNEYL